MRRGWGPTVALLLTAGCLGAVQDELPGAGRSLAELSISGAVQVLGPTVHEPALAQLPDGTLFVTGIGGQEDPAGLSAAPGAFDPPVLWRSRDGGASWARVDVGNIADGAVGASDKDLAVGPDGELYLAALTFLLFFDPVGAGVYTWEGLAIRVGVSRDGGETWDWTLISHDRFDDRPWIDVAPDGTAHLVWNDANGVYHARSTDAGRTWTEGPMVHPSGGSSGLAVGPAGEIVVRITPPNANGNGWDPEADGLRVSTDGGATWTWRELPGDRDWDGDLPRFWDPVAIDAEGALYAAWAEGSWDGPSFIQLARSPDLGVTWTTYSALSGEGNLYFPFLAARGPGDVALSAYAYEDGGTEKTEDDRVVAWIAVVADAASSAPAIRSASFVQAGYGFGEYFPVLHLREGGVGIATLLNDDERTGFEFRIAGR